MAGNPSATMSMGGTGGMAAGIAGMSAGEGGQPAAPQQCPATHLQPGETNDSVMVGGQQRTYILHVPPNYTGMTPVPLVTDWHPILTDASFERGNSGYSAKADQEGFVVVWPQGIDNAWNVGPCCTMSRTVDDVGFARAMIAKIQSQACIDAKRVFAVGYSMGAGMTYKLACDAADIIAAGAPAAFQLMDDTEWPCHPSRPITILSFNGQNDPIVPYAGGASNPPNGLPITVHFKGAANTFKAWADFDGCTGSPMPSGFGVGCQTYSQCMAGVEVTLCTNPTGGHDTGDPNVAWDMLKKHPLP
jgi:polyhydroxybutyrate depolymerase